jgi:hypothetical protein
MVVEKKGKLLGVKGLNKGKMLKQVVFCHVKRLKDGFLENGVESICDIHL